MSGIARRRSRERRAACATWAAIMGVSTRNIMRESRRPVRYSRALESLRREARREYAFGEWYRQCLQRFAEQVLGIPVKLISGPLWVDPVKDTSDRAQCVDCGKGCRFPLPSCFKSAKPQAKSSPAEASAKAGR